MSTPDQAVNPAHAAWDAVKSRRDSVAYDALDRLPDSQLCTIAAVGERLAEMAREIWRDRHRD